MFYSQIQWLEFRSGIGGKKMITIDDNYVLSSYLWQEPSLFFFSKFAIHFLFPFFKQNATMQDFLFLYLESKFLAPLNQRGDLNFPMTKTFSLQPITLATTISVSQILQWFPLVQASDQRFPILPIQ